MLLRVIINYEKYFFNYIACKPESNSDFYNAAPRYYDNLFCEMSVPKIIYIPLLRLLHAYRNNYFNYIRDLIKKTPIHWGYFEHVKTLGYVCRLCDDYYYSIDDDPVQLRKSIDDFRSIINLLLKQGVDLNQIGPFMWKSPLDSFNQGWAYDGYQWMLEKGALSSSEVLKKLWNSAYPYYLPAKDVHKETAKDRYEHFAKTHLHSSGGSSLESQVIRFDHYQKLRLRPDLPWEVCLMGDNGYTLLMQAAYSNEKDVIKRLISLGSPVNFSDHRGYTALFYTLIPKVYLFELIGEKSPFLWLANNFSPSQWRLIELSLVELLLDAGADPNWLAEAGVTPLVLAVELGKWDIVDLLLRYGADINRRDQWGRTVLHTITGVLFERPSRFRQTFGELVFQYGSQRVFEYIALPDEPNDPELDEAEEVLKASNLYHIDDLKQLLARGADPHLPDNEGITPYELAQKYRPDWAVVMHQHGEA